MLGLGTSINRGEFVASESLLLDEHSGASAAYSLRKISSSYSGNAIKVRRNGDNAELNIGFSSGVLDTSAIATHCGSNDGFVTTWYDQSGNANNATETNFAKQPKIYDGSSTAVEVVNGKPALLSDADVTLSIPLSTTAGYLIFGVSKIDRNSIFLGSENNADFVLVAQSGNTSTSINANSTINTVRKNGASHTLTNRGALFTDFSSQHLIHIDVDLTFSNANMQLGYNNAGQYPMFTTQELIFYPDTASISITAIESNINTFYSIF